MADTWPTAEDGAVETITPKPSPGGPALLKRIVRESLQRELEARRDRAPHAQLGVMVDADQPTTHRAFLRLRAHFDPRAYATHGPEAVALAGELLALVEAAYLLLGAPASDLARSLPPLAPAPRTDETLRALETLKGSIARRKSEALRLVNNGQSVEARRMFEAVLRLDPHDEVARAQLRRLKIAADKSGFRAIAAAFERLWAFIRRKVRRV
jgi:hypothetical protein